MGYAQADQNRALLPYQTEQSLMSDRFARETTGYTSAMQGELDSIIGRMNAGIQISEAEKSRAHELALEEKKYQNQLSADRQKGAGFASVNGGLYNTSTGQWAVKPPLGNFYK